MIGLQKITDWIEVEAESLADAIIKAKEKCAFDDFDNYNYIGGYKIPEED